MTFCDYSAESDFSNFGHLVQYPHSLSLPHILLPCSTLHNATALTIALHMKRVDIAQYLYSEHKLHPVLCGSLDYPPLFIEYIEYGTFEFIPWLLTEG